MCYFWKCDLRDTQKTALKPIIFEKKVCERLKALINNNKYFSPKNNCSCISKQKERL